MAAGPTSKRDDALRVERLGDATMVTIAGDHILGRVQLDGLCAQIQELIEQSKQPKIVVNLEHITHMPSSFIGWLMKFNKMVQAKGGKFVLANVNDPVYEVFELTRLTRWVTIHRRGSELQMDGPKRSGSWVLIAVLVAAGIAVAATVVLVVAIMR